MQAFVSLLERMRTQPDEAAWGGSGTCTGCSSAAGMRDPSLRDEAEDLVQRVMAVVVRADEDGIDGLSVTAR